jgi:DNA-binding NarL/FixJ family response regulator
MDTAATLGVQRLRARVLAVDDDGPFLGLLNEVLRATDQLETAGVATSGEQAVTAAERLRPEIVLMDVRMPGLGGLEAAKRIKAAQPQTLIVLISTEHPDELPRETRASFVDAVVWKPDLEPGLLDTIWLKHGGHPR